jgi:hypothetical protein
VYDRWTIQPDLNTEISDFGPDYGKPEMYTIHSGRRDQGQRVHHSRLLIFTGMELPLLEARQEEGWGASMVETMLDRLVAFDSTTLGASQLVYRAYLRTIKIKDFRQILADGGDAEQALTRQMDFIRRMQVNEGLTLLDAEDDFQATSYNFSGLDTLLLSFGEQLAGATGIPLVRLFGQSPAGLSSTGESDLRTYYDTVKATQEVDLRGPLLTICDALSRSLFGEPVPEDFWFEFAPLWDLTDMEKADIASKDTAAILSAYDSGLVSSATALRELKASGTITGRWTKITAADIEEAESAPPASELALGELGEAESSTSTPRRPTVDEDRWITTKGGHRVLVGETGEIKAGMGGRFNGRTLAGVRGSSSSGSAAAKDHVLHGRKSVTQSVYDSARGAEKSITPDMEEIAGELGAEMVGLEFSVKTASSVEDKIRRKVAAGETEENVIQGMSDLVRYTQQGRHDQIVVRAARTIKKLQEKGYDIIEVDNKYLNPDNNYKAVHINAMSPNGQKFELQIHSPESLGVKNKIHPLYEEWRKVSTSQGRRDELAKQMKEISARLPIPDDIASVSNLRRR